MVEYNVPRGTSLEKEEILRDLLFSKMGVHLGVELAIADGAEELLGDGEFQQGLVLGGARNRDIEFVGFGGEDLGVEAILGEIDRTTRGLIDGDSGNLDVDLDLDGVAVDHFAGRDGFIEDDVGLLAAIDSDGVEFTLDLDGGASALVDVDGLLFLLDGDGDGGGLVFDDPLVTLEFQLGGLVGHSGSANAKTAGGLLSSGGLLFNLTRTISTVLGLHISRHLTQTSGHTLTLVQLGKDTRHIGSV